MAIKIGTKTVSKTQYEYLATAGSTTSAGRIGELIRSVITDPDIVSGREEVHPNWKILFYKNKQRIKNAISGDRFSTLEKVFEATMLPEELDTLDPESFNMVFLLGAGASKPEPSGIPTVKELLPDLLSRAKHLDRTDLKDLSEFCENSHIDNIEDLLTAAHLSDFCSHSPIVLKLVEYLLYRRQSETEGSRFDRNNRMVVDLSAVAFLKDTLQVLFGLLSSRMLPAKPNAGHKAIAKHVKQRKHSAIVTTNYDCCVDLALGQEGMHCDYKLEFTNKSNTLNGSLSTPLIKLHGSLNWFYCETCQQVHLIDIKKTVEDYQNDSTPYSIIAVCRVCGGQRRGLLIPPSALKFDAAPPLVPLIEKAQVTFNSADMLIVVGFSFADADLYISRMLVKALQKNSDLRILIFDTDPTVAEKVRNQFGVRISNFNPDRILFVEGDCSKTLPQFLEGGYLKTKKRAPNPKRRASRKTSSPTVENAS